MTEPANGETMPPASKPALFVECVRKDGVIIARLVGPSIGQREAPIISKAVIAEIEKPGDAPYAAVLDFKRVNFLNSMGLSMCIEVRNAMHNIGGRTILYRLSDQVAAVLKMTKMDRMYTIVSEKTQLDKALRR